MKSFKLFLIAFAAAGLLLFTYCSDDDDNNPTNNNGDKDYYPMKVGNFWIYENNDLDINGDYIDGTFSMDSVVITEVGTVHGKSGFKHVSYMKEDVNDAWEYDSETYFYSEGDKLYGLFEYIAPDDEELPLPLEFEEGWILLADPTANNPWQIFSQNFEDQEFTYEGISLTINGDFTITGDKGETATFEHEGNSVTAQEYVFEYEFIGTANFIVDIQFDFTITAHLWFAENIGLVEFTVDPTTVALGSYFSTDIEGSESVLDRYFVQD